MIMRYETLKHHAPVFKSVTGLYLVEFDQLIRDITPLWEVAEAQRLYRAGRQRAPGGGEAPYLDGRDQLLLTIIWLRVYPTHAVLGYLFGVSQPTVSRYLKRGLRVLEQAGRDTMRLPDPGRKRRRGLPQLLQDMPELTVVVDTFEQRVQRPQSAAEQNEWYSGKQRTHTIKSQVTVEQQTGRIVHVSASVQGRSSALTLLRTCGVLEQLPKTVGVLGDTGYQGIAKLHPLGHSPRKRHNGRRVLTEDDRAYNRAFAQERIVVEMSLNRVRRYQALKQTDRQHRQGHQARVCAVAGLVNRQLAYRLAA
ncbi:MAG: transposase family protein [Armatimonadetes bacterium]|nr:transposase family protein [Anaerolineae bacterium]